MLCINISIIQTIIKFQMAEQFSEAAGKLLDRINSISFLEKKEKTNENIQTLHKGQLRKAWVNRPLNTNMASPQTQTLLELSRMEQELGQSQEQNIKKLKHLNQQVRKMENLVKQQNESRLKLHESFIHSVIKAEKSMQSSVASIRKLYSEREKKLEQKIEQVLRQEKKQILDELQSNTSLEENLQRVKAKVQGIKQEIVHMRRTRLELEDKIGKQFNDQISDLKCVFSNSIKSRQQKELRILEALKNIYKTNLDCIKKEEVEREASERMFLTVIEQLIDRITQA